MNTMPKRKVLILSDRAAELLPKLAGYQEQGRYVSRLIEAAGESASLYRELEAEIQQFKTKLAELEQRVDRAAIAATHARLIPDEQSPPYDVTR
jgi:hypothetical protein